MVQSTSDPCLLHTNKVGLFGVVGVVEVQTDDSLFTGNDNFVKLENEEVNKARILTKTVEKLLPRNQIIFNAGIIRHDGTSVFLEPKGQGEKFSLIDIKSPSLINEYVAQRARGAYISTVC